MFSEARPPAALESECGDRSPLPLSYADGFKCGDSDGAMMTDMEVGRRGVVVVVVVDRECGDGEG